MTTPEVERLTAERDEARHAHSELLMVIATLTGKVNPQRELGDLVVWSQEERKRIRALEAEVKELRAEPREGAYQRALQEMRGLREECQILRELRADDNANYSMLWDKHRKLQSDLSKATDEVEHLCQRLAEVEQERDAARSAIVEFGRALKISP